MSVLLRPDFPGPPDARDVLIRALKLQLYMQENGMGMGPRDEDAIARTERELARLEGMRP